MTDDALASPLLAPKDWASPSAFTPEGLLREARRQRSLPSLPVPQTCVLDPDGDIVRRMVAAGCARRHPGWACYHTELQVIEYAGKSFGVVGCAVGAPFAVLVAEQLFASGCRLLISVTSAGQLVASRPPPYFVLIERAFRDEGTSLHYLPPSKYSVAPPRLVARLDDAFADLTTSVVRGDSWTTDAPYRETETTIAAMRARGLLAVEMEAAALYAFAAARNRDVICFAHVTNQMATVEGDFEKGEADGVTGSLEVIVHVADRLAEPQSSG